MEVYVDVLIFENILVDLLLLLLTYKIAKVEYRTKQLYIAAIVGGLYSLIVFCDIKILSSVPMSLIVAMVMIYIAMKNRNILMSVKLTIVYFLLSFMLAGMCFGLALMQNTYSIGESFSISKISIKSIILSVVVLGIVIIRVMDRIRSRVCLKSFIYDIYINQGEKTLLLRGLLDTGNELREPATNLPCIIIEKDYIEKFNIPENELFIINYKTINEDSSLYGFKSKEIRIRNIDEQNWVKVDAIICGCENQLSKENEFQALLSRGVI